MLLYWSIGIAVSEKIQSAGWGESAVEQLAKDLQTELPGVRGFSVRNIWRMKMFAEFYTSLGVSATVAAEIETPQILATAVTKLQSNENQADLVTANSATAVAELQKHVYD